LGYLDLLLCELKLGYIEAGATVLVESAWSWVGIVEMHVAWRASAVGAGLQDHGGGWILDTPKVALALVSDHRQFGVFGDQEICRHITVY
jgi:hypothetical protein